MWAILRINNNKYKMLTKSLNAELKSKAIFYFPKVIIQKIKLNKKKSAQCSVLGNYVFRIGGNSATVNPGSNVFITDGSDNLKAGSYFLSHLDSNGQTPTWTATQCAYLTPGTTSSYTIKVRCNNASEGGLVQFYGSSNNSYSTNLTLMEIAA